MKLYDSTGTIQIGDLSDNIIECIVEEERNGLFELTLTYPASYDYSLDLIKENIIVANANNILLNQKFRIYNIRKKYSNMIEVCARHISYDLLDDFIENINIENQSCEYALNQIFKNSQFSKNYKGYSDIINSQNYKSNMSNCLNAIVGQRGSIIDTFGTGAEILRENENIYILNKRGHDNGVSITYGDNMSAFTCEEDTTDLITRIYPYIKNSEEGKENIITLPERFVDSPIIAKYSHPYIKSIDFSDKFEQGEEFNLAKLKLEAEKYFIQNKCDIPKMTFNVDFVLIEKYNLSLCDIVTINHKVYNIITQSKVIKASFDVIKNRYKKMTLGDSKATLGDLMGGSPSVGPPGKDGIQGPPGKDGEEFPDMLPEVPVLNADLKGFASVDLSWAFENKVYYSYQLFASKIDSNPNAFDLIFEGQGSSFLHQVKPGETWFYWVRALNSYGKATELSNKLTITTKKEDDFDNYFSNLAVKDLVVNMFSVDYMEAGIIKGYWIDAKQLSVTDGNGKRTLDIDSFGNVRLDVSEFKVNSKSVATEEYTNTQIGLATDKINQTVEKTTNSGITNLISYTDFESKELIKDNWWIQGAGNWYESGATKLIGLQNNYSSETMIHSKAIKGFENKVSIFADIKIENADCEIMILGSRTEELDYSYTLSALRFTNKHQQEKKLLEGIIIPSHIKTLWIRIDNEGVKNSDTSKSNTIFVNILTLVNGEVARKEKILNGSEIAGLSIKSKEVELSVKEKVNEKELISKINMSSEKIKILAKFLELTGYATFKDLLEEGSTEINGSNIITGILKALQIEACHFSGKNMVYIEENGVLSCDGQTYIRDFFVPETHPGWHPSSRGSFSVAPTAFFNKDVHAGGEVYSKGTGVVRRENGVFIQVDALGVQSASPNNYLLIKGYQSDHAFGVDLWYSDAKLKENIMPLKTRPLNNKITGLELIKSIEHYTYNYKESAGLGTGQVDCGYIAQQLQKINPALVREVKQQDDTVNLEPVISSIIPNLSLAIQQQQSYIEQLESRLERLEKMIGGK